MNSDYMDIVMEETVENPVNESLIGGILVAIATYVTALILMIGAILLIVVAGDKRHKKIKEDIKKNPKSRKLIEEAGLKMQDFIYKNLPSDIRKYCIKNKIDLAESSEYKQRFQNTIDFVILEFDWSKMIKSFVGSKYNCTNDLLNAEYEDVDYDNADVYIDIYSKNNKLNYDKYEDFLIHCNEEINKLNKQIKKANLIYSTNCKIDFEDYDGAITPNDTCAPYIMFRFDIPQFSISSFTDKELNQIEKVCNIKLDK